MKTSLLQGATGPTGPTGPTGTTGVTGATGATGSFVRCYRNEVKNPCNYITVASNSAFNISSPSKFTVRFWWRAPVTQANAGLATRSSLASSQGDWAVIISNTGTNCPQFNINGSARATSTTPVAVGTWTFIECSYDSSLGSNNVKIFIAGVLDTQANYSTVVTNTAVALSLGLYFDTGFGQIGYISEFEFCANKVRNTVGYTPPSTITADADTTVLWKLNEDRFATDSSGNGFNGTQTANNPWETTLRQLS